MVGRVGRVCLSLGEKRVEPCLSQNCALLCALDRGNSQVFLWFFPPVVRSRLSFPERSRDSTKKGLCLSKQERVYDMYARLNFKPSTLCACPCHAVFVSHRRVSLGLMFFFLSVLCSR